MPVTLVVMAVERKDSIDHKKKMTVANLLKDQGIDLEKIKEKSNAKDVKITVNGQEVKLDAKVKDNDLVVITPLIDQGR